MINNAFLRILVSVQTFIRRSEGQAMTEYALIIAVIAVIVISAFIMLGDKISNTISNIANSIGS
jgi:pilus assembly protein Flp/PilA